jgi:hypothetical protein
MGGACSTHWRDENGYNILVGKCEGKRPLGGTWRRWEGDTGMEVREIGWIVVDLIRMAQDRGQWWDIFDMITDVRVP